MRRLFAASDIHFVLLYIRSEIAWRDAKYAKIHEYLREEYEVTQRFGNLDFKLKFVEVTCLVRFIKSSVSSSTWSLVSFILVENAVLVV